MGKLLILLVFSLLGNFFPGYCATSADSYDDRRVKPNPSSKPIPGLTEAMLANKYISLRQADLARVELQKAEALNNTNDFELETSLLQGCANLHEVIPAIKHFKVCIALAEAAHRPPQTVESLKTGCADFESRLTPTYLHIALPPQYSTIELTYVLKQKLSAPEAKSVRNPLTCSEPMSSWTRSIVASGSNELEKCHLLFEALAHRLDGTDMHFYTAEEAFDNWTNRSVSLHCQDYAFLYTSLARSIGVKAFVVYVSETCYGERTDHACSAIFINAKSLLIDPSYFWF
jgi:hypothetical protein